MTRILLIGNSHAATLRRAFPDFAMLHPAVGLTFWGLPGAAFDKASVGADGLLRPDPTDRVSARKVDQWNDSDHADLTGHDRIFLVGLRFHLRPVLTLLRHLQPLNWGRRTGALGVSDGFLRAAIRAEVDLTLSAQLARIPLDPRAILMPAPYPSALVARRDGAHYEPVTAAASGLPHAADLMTLFEAEIEAACAAHGLGFVAQPRETLAAPFLTQDRFLEDATRDARHMNARYGLVAMQALAQFPNPQETPASVTPDRRLSPAKEGKSNALGS